MIIKANDTIISRAMQAQSYVNNLMESNNGTPWVILGGTTAWTNENNPPYLSINKKTILDAEVCVPLYAIRFIYPSLTGTITIDDVSYSFVENKIEDIVKRSALIVLLQIKVNLSNVSLPSNQFRVAGITNSITFKSPVSTSYSLFSNVQSYEINTFLSFPPINTSEVNILNVTKVF